MLSDLTYQCINQPDIDISNHRQLFVPQVLPYSTKIQNPYGRRINHISIQANLKTQPVMTDTDAKPDLIPFAIIGHKAHLLRLVSKCTNISDLFLELSLVVHGSTFNLKVAEDWLATVKLRDADLQTRSTLISKFCPAVRDYFAIVENVEIKPQVQFMRLPPSLPREGFVKLFSVLNGQRVLLTELDGYDYQYSRYNYVTVALNPAINADYYIALPGADLRDFNMSRTFAQAVLPAMHSPIPVFSEHYNPVGTFAVRQFNSQVYFAPPFTSCSNNFLTALEIVVSCRPAQLLMNSNSVLQDIVNSGQNSESIKRQVYATHILDFCVDKDIPLKVLGDICQLTQS